MKWRNVGAADTGVSVGAIVVVSVIRSASGYALEGHRHGPAAAEAEGRQAVAPLAPLELVEQRGDDACTTRPDRVAERDRPAVDVDLREVEAELATVGEDL